MGSTNYDKTPLQLVQLGPSSQNDDNPNLILNEVNFATLIEKIGERPLSVYCLTGPQKTGKSLLFGYMVQYLTAAENDNPDWIEPTGSDDKLTQELQWSTEKLIGASPGEPGIWCFNRPFILSHGEDQNRKEVAVLLLYAQMSGKYRWSSIDSALIGLAISAASCTIFNVEKEINERILSAIASHAQYAFHGAFPNDSNGSLGQAVFVIRDWNFPTEFPYGMSGGNKFLMDEKLCDNSTHSREARVNRSFIKSAFDKISGCLLPFPGLQVLSSEFGGSTSEMDDQFVDELEHFICDIINLDKPLLKHDVKRQEIHGGLQWKSAWESYIKTINHVQLDTKKLLKASGVNGNPSVEEQKEMMKIGVKMYREVWRQSGKDWNSMKEKEFRDLHRRAKNKAMEAWKKKIIGDSESEDDGDEQESTFSVDQGVERHFMAKLDEKFEKMKLSRTRKQEETIENCKIDMIAQYEKSLEAVLSPEKGKSFSREKIKRHSEEMIGCLVADFEDRTGEKSPQIVKNEFKEKLVQIEAKIIDRVFSTPINTDDNCYSLLNTETMNSDEEDTVASNMGSLKTKKYPPVTDMDFKYMSLPNFGRLQENCVKADGAHQKIAKDQLKEQTAKLIDNLKYEYSLKLQKSVSLENNEAVDEEKSKVIHNFEAQCSYEKGTEEFQQYRSILEKELNLVLVNLKMKRDKENRTKDNRLNEAVVGGLQSYLDKLKRFVLDRNGKVTADELEHASAQYLNAELEALSSQFHESIGGEVIKYREELEEKIGNAFINFRKDHVTSQTIADQQVMTLINNTIHEYETEMKSSMSHAKNEEDLSVAHIDTMGRTMEKLRAKSDKITDAHLNNLKSDLEAAFSQLRGKFQLKLDGEAGTEKLTLSNSRAFYCSEMEKHLKNHDFIAPEELCKIHEQVRETALTRISNDDKKNELMEMLEEAWIKYRDANQMNMDAEPVIGIDLGTTFSCVSIYQRGEIKIIPNSMGKLTTPSYVLFRESGKKIVGEEAKNRAYENPEGTIFDAKRILGRKFDDEKLQEDMKLWPFSVVDGGRGVPMFEINGKRLHPEMVSAIVLAKLKKDAEAYLKQKVKKAVITVPAYFTEGQKLATAHAGKIAGLEVLSTITEPVAAAMAYNLQYGLDDQKVANGGLKERHILIFDLGGGTFDVAVLKTKKGKIETLTIDGDTHLGGEDFDKNMMLYCAEEFKKIHQVDLFKGKDSPVKKVRDEVRRRLKRLQGECEQQKIFLATGRAVNICVSRIYNGIDLNVTITRKAFEKMNDKLFQSTIQIVEKALKSANVDKSQIDDIVLVGGSTRIPKIQRLLRDYFNGKPLNMKINPDEAVAHGAGLFAAIKKGTVTKDSPAFTRIQDVTPMPIGVEIYGGGFSTIIPKSTKIPVILQELYKTAHNNQTSVQITIYEGENPVAVNNQKLGDFYLNGIPPKDAGEENIEVEMVVNEDGILNVTGKCTGSGKSEAVSVYEYKQRMGEAAIQQYLAMTTDVF